MKTGFSIKKDSFLARTAIACLLLSVLFRGLGTIGHFSDSQFLTYRFMLPSVSSLLYIVCILLFGKKGFWTTLVPFIGFVVFFFMRILSNDNLEKVNVESLQIAISIAIYIAVAVIYSGTIFGAIKSKIFLVMVFGFAFVYHIVFQDYPAISSKTVSAEAIFMELGVLFIFAGLLITSMALKKKKPDEMPEVAAEVQESSSDDVPQLTEQQDVQSVLSDLIGSSEKEESSEEIKKPEENTDVKNLEPLQDEQLDNTGDISQSDEVVPQIFEEEVKVEQESKPDETIKERFFRKRK